MGKGRCSLHRALRRQKVAIEIGDPSLRQTRLHHLKATADAGQEVVEVMCEAAGELPNRLHLLRLAKALLHRMLLTQVASDLGEADQFSVVVGDRIDDDISPELGAILPNAPSFC